MAPTQHDREDRLEAGYLLSTEEKRIGSPQVPGVQEFTQHHYDDNNDVPALEQKTRKMSPLRKVLMAVLVGLIVGMGVASARPSFISCAMKHREAKPDMAKIEAAKSELSKDVQLASPDVLHRLLHAYLPERFQHGVFASDSEAINAINEDNPSVASAIVKIAKRQDDVSSSNATTAATTASSSPTSSFETLESVTTADVSSTSIESSSSADVSTTDVATTTQESTTVPSSTTLDVSTTADTTTSDAATSTTDAATTSASTPTSTSTSAPSTITSGTRTTSSPVAQTFTRTLPDGGTTTLTSTSWVAVVPTGQSDGSRSPDLQNAATLPRAGLMVPAAVGVLAGAILMV